MKNKQKFRLTEQDIKNIMESATKRILKEGSVETRDVASWQHLTEMIGAEAMLDMVWNYLDSQEIRGLIDYIQDELSADGYEYEEDSDYPSF